MPWNRVEGVGYVFQISPCIVRDVRSVIIIHVIHAASLQPELITNDTRSLFSMPLPEHTLDVAEVNSFSMQQHEIMIHQVGSLVEE